ncbi:acyl carrier protein [Hydrogenophaga sp.]|jgi:acyl carrier protein|uniref:acyl carrier protein n=1 Tax=Hydrogenophaga sp. TaxID=1904254 RepID=UPI00263668B3|nr:acyl carrier protein [Hydrogenophaga sp.]
MNVYEQVLRVLDSALNLQGRGATFDAATPLLGALPELDSMAVLALITELESHFGITFNDEDLHAEVFATVGSLNALVQQQLDRHST